MGGTAKTQGSAGENITHFTALRFRIQGEGNLDLQMLSQDEVITQDLVPLTMLLLNPMQPTRLCNFMQQRAMFRLGTDRMNEWFRINRIIVFTKETFSSYPA